ncbi:MAG: orotidine-5'-phosphate decarboxylase [Pelagibacterales bacterium]|mgnify:FL=1|nr:orotidine-5'-phosphate decarboxylase [Pelagibacterales bacterium]PPR16698.1 MAG: Orotidine 5'-phosphate decarboxylase [Alphaproteobacteria bacterium MarineAlpha9_Bin3]|tara:strand:- start:2318 stop:3022 length:705 start_codon:yes stop_codon:yes gene_type:complete
MGIKNKIIVALDTVDTNQALKLTETIPGIGAIKLGLEYFCFNGPKGVKLISETGAKIFLDLKFHDIPNTVAGAIKAILHLHPYMITVHLSGGYDMLIKANEIVTEYCIKNSIKKPIILGVSVLTSLDQKDFISLGIKGNVQEQVIRLAKLAKNSGLDGLVSSAKELKIIREEIGQDLLLVTPGIRPIGGQINDQKRIVTPSQAINDGANFLVIGRPITAAKDPKEALNQISKEI